MLSLNITEPNNIIEGRKPNANRMWNLKVPRLQWSQYMQATVLLKK